MGLLDSNKILPQTKKIVITDKACTAGGYITSGLLDVKEYSLAIVHISGSNFAEGVTMSVKTYISVLNNGNAVKTAEFISLNQNAALSSVTTNGPYVVDVSKAARWSLMTDTAGTFNVEIYLVPTSTNVSANVLLEKIRALVNTTNTNVAGINTNINTIAGKAASIEGNTKSLDGVYSETEGSFSLNGTAGVKLTKNVTKEYSTMSIEVVLSDANPFGITGTLRKSNSVLVDPVVFRSGSGELIDKITDAGLYYVDIKGASSVVLGQIASGTSASGTVTYRLLKEEPIDYKPIQEIYTIEKTFEGGETSADLTLSTQNKVLKYFKFIKAEINYTGTNAPAATISVAPYYGSGVWGAFKEIYTINGKKDSIDWFMNVGQSITFRFTFRGGFTPAENDVLKVKLFGMR